MAFFRFHPKLERRIVEIILFRHGIAEDHSPDASDDGRRLTEAGQRRTRQVARGLATILTPDKTDAANHPTPEKWVVLTSPKVRARQTAELVAQALHADEPDIVPLLAEPDARAIAGYLAGHAHARVIAVGHEPSLGQVAAYLCGGDPCLNILEMKKAAAALIELPDDKRKTAAPGYLRWLLPPSILRRLRG